MNSRYIIVAILLGFSSVSAAPNNGNANPLQQVREVVNTLRHELSNQEAELRMCEQRINNQEDTISSLRQDVLDTSQTLRDSIKSQTTSLFERLGSLESSNKVLASDIELLRKHANDTTAALEMCKQKFSDLDKSLQLQHQNTENLHAALKSITEALQIKENVASIASVEDATKAYRVKPGDTLEKVARANKTTIKAIKELNNMRNDKIIVDQVLQLP